MQEGPTSRKPTSRANDPHIFPATFKFRIILLITVTGRRRVPLEKLLYVNNTTWHVSRGPRVSNRVHNLQACGHSEYVRATGGANDTNSWLLVTAHSEPIYFAWRSNEKPFFPWREIRVPYPGIIKKRVSITALITVWWKL